MSTEATEAGTQQIPGDPTRTDSRSAVGVFIPDTSLRIWQIRRGRLVVADPQCYLLGLYRTAPSPIAAAEPSAAPSATQTTTPSPRRGKYGAQALDRRTRTRRDHGGLPAPSIRTHRACDGRIGTNTAADLANADVEDGSGGAFPGSSCCRKPTPMGKKIYAFCHRLCTA